MMINPDLNKNPEEQQGILLIGRSQMIAKIGCFLLPIVFRNKYPENKVANRQLHGHPVFYRTLELP